MATTIDPPRKVRGFIRRSPAALTADHDLIVPPPTTEAPAPPQVNVSVNLLPDEVIAGRAARAARLVAIVLVLVAALGTGAWAYHANGQVAGARTDLAAAQADDAATLAKQSGFSDLKKVQAEIAAAQSRVTAATPGGLDSSRLIPAVYGVIPDGITLTSVAGQVATAAEASAATAGSLIISGTSTNKALVSAFALKLATVKGLQNPFVTTVSTDDKGLVTFSIQVSVTAQAAANRYAKGIR